MGRVQVQMMASGSGPSGLSQLSSPPLHVSQLSGMTPSQLLLSQPLNTGSAFQPLRIPTSQQQQKPRPELPESDNRSHEVTRPQVRLFPLTVQAAWAIQGRMTFSV